MKRQSHVKMQALISLLQKMGWTMAIPEIAPDGSFSGAIIGTHEFVQAAVSTLQDEETEGEKA